MFETRGQTQTGRHTQRVHSVSKQEQSCTVFEHFFLLLLQSSISEDPALKAFDRLTNKHGCT